MKKHFYRTMAALILGVFIGMECLSGYGAAYSYAADNTQASQYLHPFEEAAEELEKLAAKQEIQAVVYLEDTVLLKSLPDESSETVKELVSGDVVRIIGVGQDADYSIWYRVSYIQETETVFGYLRRTNLACVQEDFVQWESNYVRSVSVFRRMARSISYPDVEQFPASYQDMLYQLKQQHPNWIFVRMNTGISWNTLVSNQLGERSLIYASTSPAEWKNGMYGTNWAYASEKILKYYLDPRNFLNEKGIFQFELLGYSEEFHSVEAVEHILSGSFMYNSTIENGKTYAQNFVELGQTTKVSPFLMASRVRQEQGAKGSSPLISGTYAGYEGYYNYYNIGASGKTDKEIIESGLAKAKTEGWNSRYKSLAAGAEFLGGSYIKHGQDTLYLQKFDVDSRYDGVFWHQYMQNIEAPYKEALSVRAAYEKAGLLDSAYVFRIPVYEGMPSSACVKPGDEDKITLSSTRIDNLQVDSQVTLHPYINGKEAEGVEWEFVSSDPAVASVDSNGTVKALKPGTTTITCCKKEDMDNTLEGTCTVTVIKADIDVSALQLPILEDITYNPKGSLKDITLPEGYKWVNQDMVPTVKQSSYGVEYNPDNSKYNSIILDLSLIVRKAVPEYTTPTNLQGGATRELSSVQLPQGFSWENPTQLLPNTIGNITAKASYNPDIENYETVEGISVTVKVVCQKHSFGEWVITEAECEKDGTKIRSCTICGAEEKIILPATGHSYSSAVTNEATQEKEGERVFTCSNCQHTYTESIPKLPAKHQHSYQEEVVTKATCTSEGLVRYTCSCKDTYEQVIPATGHDMKAGICVNCGYKEKADSNTAGGSTANGNTSSNTAQNGTGSAGNSGNTGTTNSNTGGGSGSTGNVNVGNTNTGSGNSSTNTGNTGTANSTTGGSNSGGNTGNVNAGNTNTGSGNSSTNTGNTGTANSTTGGSNSGGNTGNVNAGNTNTGSGNSSTSTGNTGTANSTTGSMGAANTTKPETSAGTTASNPAASNTTGANTSPAGNKEAQIISDVVDKTKKEENTSASTKVEKVVLQLNDNTNISKQIVDLAVDQGVDLEVVLRNGISWNLDTKTIGQAAIEEMDMNVQLQKGIIDAGLIETLAEGRDYLEIRLAHDGEFGFTALLTIPVAEDNIGRLANLFYMNEETGKLEYQMVSEVTEEAEVSFTFSHASDYLIVFADEDMEEAASRLTENEETEAGEEALANQEKSAQGGKTVIIIVCVLILLLAVALIGLGIWLSKKRAAEGMDSSEEEDYLDDDIDDYQERS